MSNNSRTLWVWKIIFLYNNPFYVCACKYLQNQVQGALLEQLVQPPGTVHKERMIHPRTAWDPGNLATTYGHHCLLAWLLLRCDCILLFSSKTAKISQPKICAPCKSCHTECGLQSPAPSRRESRSYCPTRTAPRVPGMPECPEGWNRIQFRSPHRERIHSTCVDSKSEEFTKLWKLKHDTRMINGRARKAKGTKN